MREVHYHTRDGLYIRVMQNHRHYSKLPIQLFRVRRLDLIVRSHSVVYIEEHIYHIVLLSLCYQVKCLLFLRICAYLEALWLYSLFVEVDDYAPSPVCSLTLHLNQPTRHQKWYYVLGRENNLLYLFVNSA